MNKPLILKKKALVLSVCSALSIAPLSQAVELDFGDTSPVTGSIDFTLGYAGSVRATDANKEAIFKTLAMQGEQAFYPVPNMASDAAAPDAGDMISNLGKITTGINLYWENYGFVGSFTYQYDSEIMDENNGQVRLMHEYREYLANTTGQVIPGIEDVFVPNPDAGIYGMGDQWTKAAEDGQGNAFDILDAYIFGEYYIGDNPLEVRLGKQVINWGEGLFYLDGVAQQVPLNISKLVTPGSELKEAYIGVESLYFNLGIGEASSLEAYYHFKWRRNEWPIHGSFYGDDTLFRGAKQAWNTDLSSEAAFPAPGFRGENIEASNSGQFGAAYRTMLGNDTEVGIYYARYHDANPVLTLSNNSDPTTQFTQQLIIDNTVGTGELTGAFSGEILEMYGMPFGGAFDAAGDPGDPTGEAIALSEQSSAVLGLFGAQAGDGMSMQQKWIEDLDMIGASFATTLGSWSLNGELAYRPDRPVFTNFWNHNGECVEGCAFFTNGDAYEEHDSTHASVHGIWLGGPLVGGITSQLLLVQVAADHLGGDVNNVMAHNSVHRESSSSTYADSTAYGVSAQWTGTWQGIYPSTDLILDIFLQKDIKGNSHFFGNFAEDRLLGAVSVTANISQAWEASLGYQWTDQDNSYYDTQDAYNFSINYKF